MKTGKLMIFVCLVLAFGQCAFYWTRLPPRLASHFGANGQANGWQSKEAFFGLDLFIVVLLATIFLGMPQLIRRLPVSMINLPNKDYWLAPERREESLAFMEDQLECIGAAALLLLVVVMQLAIGANLNGSATLPPATGIPLVVMFLGVELICTIRLLTRFSARPKDS